MNYLQPIGAKIVIYFRVLIGEFTIITSTDHRSGCSKLHFPEHNEIESLCSSITLQQLVDLRH